MGAGQNDSNKVKKSKQEEPSVCQKTLKKAFFYTFTGSKWSHKARYMTELQKVQSTVCSGQELPTQTFRY